MRIRDWSSDVCSSDLAHQVPAAAQACNIRTEPRLVSVLVAGIRRQRSPKSRTVRALARHAIASVRACNGCGRYALVLSIRRVGPWERHLLPAVRVGGKLGWGFTL